MTVQKGSECQPGLGTVLFAPEYLQGTNAGWSRGNAVEIEVAKSSNPEATAGQLVKLGARRTGGRPGCGLAVR